MVGNSPSAAELPQGNLGSAKPFTRQLSPAHPLRHRRRSRFCGYKCCGADRNGKQSATDHNWIVSTAKRGICRTRALQLHLDYRAITIDSDIKTGGSTEHQQLPKISNLFFLVHKNPCNRSCQVGTDHQDGTATSYPGRSHTVNICPTHPNLSLFHKNAATEEHGWTSATTNGDHCTLLTPNQVMSRHIS